MTEAEASYSPKRGAMKPQAHQLHMKNQQHLEVQNIIEAIKRPYIDIKPMLGESSNSFKLRLTQQAHSIKQKYANKSKSIFSPDASMQVKKKGIFAPQDVVLTPKSRNSPMKDLKTGEFDINTPIISESPIVCKGPKEHSKTFVNSTTHMEKKKPMFQSCN